MQDLVSVIVPVYNSEKTIEKAIKSVVLQTYSNLQILVVDDCSTDNTVNIIKNMAQEDSRICYYINSKNLGVAETRNFACNQAKGTYIAFLDSDDEWYPEKLQLQLEYLSQFEGDICYTAYEIVDKYKDNVYKKYMVPLQVSYKELLKENVICCSTVLIKKEILDKNPFTTEYFHEDFILWLNLLKKGNIAIGLQQYLTRYTKGGRSSDKINAMYNRWQIYRKYEHLHIISAIYYFVFYGINGIRKYYINKKSYTSIKHEVIRRSEI